MIRGERRSRKENRERGEDSASWKEREGWIKLDPPVPKELAMATGSSQAVFQHLEIRGQEMSKSCCGDDTRGLKDRSLRALMVEMGILE